MYVNQGGELYGFCPGKSTWDAEATNLLNILLISAETGALLYNGGIANQPDWFIELLAWFLPKYDQMKFSSKADMILGGDKKEALSRLPGPHRINSPSKG